MQKLRVHVGSTSEHKLLAVRESLDELSIQGDVVGFQAKSKVPEQPIGIGEIVGGARNRCNAVIVIDRANADLAIGIENGIVEIDERSHIDFAIVQLWSRDPNVSFLANSAGHQIHTEDLVLARWRGLGQCTAATITSERTKCSKTDATPHYTGGRMNRVELLKQAVKLVLCQWLAAKEAT